LTRRKGALREERKPGREFALRDRYVCAALVLASLLARIPFLKNFDLVSYDGTYYINQARSLLSGHAASAFPIGYPAFIALFMPIIHDGVRAAQAVSLLAGLASLCVFYLLCIRFVRRELALVGAIVLAVTPLYIQVSLLTMSESLYLFWLLLGLLLYSREHFGRSGLSLGMAAITRPEALGIALVLGLFKLRQRRILLRLMASFALIYALGMAALSLSVGQVQLLSKAGNLGLSAHAWQKREAWIDSKLSAPAKEELEHKDRAANQVADYLKRLPRELWLLHRHLLTVAFLLALYGIVKRRGYLLAALVPLFLYPAFTPRSEPRFILPYLVVLLIYALVAVEGLAEVKRQRLLAAGLVLAGAIGVGLNSPLLTRSTAPQFEFSREAAKMLKQKHLIEPDDLVADRKPYFAFYAGARYLEIPVAGYEETMAFLAHENVRYLMLEKSVIHSLRPALRPLLYDRAAINGELRFSQFYLRSGEGILYRRDRASDPLTRTRFTPPGEQQYVSPSWSPDGRALAFRVADSETQSRICIRELGTAERTVLSQGNFLDEVSWSPNGRALAVSVLEGHDVDIAILDLDHETLTPIAPDPALDVSPNWSPDGKTIAFSSQRSGADEIWLVHLDTGELEQLTKDGGNHFPAFSPTGDRLAWTRENDGVQLLELSARKRSRFAWPQEVFYRPAWNRDGRCLAITAQGPVNKCLYLLDTQTGRCLQLSKSYDSTGLSSFNPLDDRLAVVIYPRGDSAIWILDGLQAYLDRLYHPVRIETFPRPGDAP